MIFLLTILLLILLLFVYVYTKKDIISPAFLFTLSFIPMCFIAIINYKNWGLNLNIKTFLVVFGGVFEFIIITFAINFFAKKNNFENSKDDTKIIDKYNISLSKKLLFFVFLVFFDLLYLYFVVKAVGGSFSNFASISNSISRYDKLTKFSDASDLKSIPSILTNIRVMFIASGYWFIYVTIFNYIKTRKVEKMNILIIIFIAILSLLQGGRTVLFYYLLSLVVLYIFLSRKINNKTLSKVDFKNVKKMIVLIIIFIALFIPLANLLGRNVNSSFGYYISIYCGAQIKNLDTFIVNNNVPINSKKILKSQTFINIVKPIASKLKINGYSSYRLVLPFQRYNGNSLGNVYTIFYPFLYDYGYIGVLLLVLLMAAISQIVYIKSINNNNYDVPSISALVYNFICITLILSFFSNKFYEQVFSVNFIKYLIVWYLCNFYFIKIKFVYK